MHKTHIDTVKASFEAERQKAQIEVIDTKSSPKPKEPKMKARFSKIVRAIAYTHTLTALSSLPPAIQDEICSEAGSLSMAANRAVHGA